MVKAVGSADEFDELVDEFGRECGKLGASDPALCYDPNRRYYVEEVNKMRALIKQAYREALTGDP